MQNKIIYIIIFIFTSAISLKADLCQDYMILDGSEPLMTYGMDSTDNWWAITKPFTDMYRLVVNGEETDVYDDLTYPRFSPDGMKWGCFGVYNSQWYILDERETNEIRADDYGEIVFSGDSKKMIYSYFKGSVEKIIVGERTFSVLNRVSSIFTDFRGNKIAFTGRRGNGLTLNVNGKESTIYEDIIPVGFWHNGEMVYCAKNGGSWQVMIGNKAISSTYQGIKYKQINRFGTVVAIVAKDFSGRDVAVLFADEYNDPIVSRSYEFIDNLALHPSLPLMAYTAAKLHTYVIVYNTTEYNAGQIYGRPFFTADGDEMYFAGCDFDCFINVNGRQFVLDNNISVDLGIVKKSNSETIAYSTNSNLVLLHLRLGSMHAGMMVDEAIPPRYNWRYDRYEAIGRIYDRLYLLTCTPPN